MRQYYVQGIKGLLVLYNREVARTKFLNFIRNFALTSAIVIVAFASFLYLVTNPHPNTDHDPSHPVTQTSPLT